MAIEIKTSFYRYMLSTFDILIPGMDPIDIKNHIGGMLIEKDFDDDIVPVFGITVSLNFIQYYNIINNKSEVKFKVKLDKYECEQNNQIDQIKYKETVFDSLFGLYIDDDNAFLDKNLFEQAASELRISEDETLQTYEFYLFKEEDLKASRTIINRIVSKGTLTDVVTYLFSVTNTKRVLMSPLHNSTKYTEIILPPIPLWQSVSYLENQYGFYKYGVTFFYDFDRTYFIDRGPRCTAWENGEIQTVILTCSKDADKDVVVPGSYKDITNKCYKIYLFRNKLQMRSASIQEDQLTSTNISLINPQDGSVEDITPNVTTRVGNKRYLVNNYNNQYLNSMIEYNKTLNDHIIYAELTDVDITCLTPNKQFSVLFTDKEINITHGGYYKLSSTMLQFERLSDAEFKVIASAELKKVP